MKIAITGSNGFVGKPVVKNALQCGHEVIGIDLSESPALSTQELSNFTYVQADLTNYDATFNAVRGSQAIIHLAGRREPGDYLVLTHNTNTVISWNVLRAAAELGINRIAMASSINVITMIYSQKCDFRYFPIDELHPCLPDEPYGLSKVIGEMQAESIVRRYPNMRIASIRLHWSLPSVAEAIASDPGGNARKHLWGYTQEDSVADAFLRAVVDDNGRWSGHEAFFIVAPKHAYWQGKDEHEKVDAKDLREKYWPDVPVKEGFEISGSVGFFDCNKAKRLLGWIHKD